MMTAFTVLNKTLLCDPLSSPPLGVVLSSALLSYPFGNQASVILSCSLLFGVCTPYSNVKYLMDGC